MKPYQEQFPIGTTVRISERPELERFRREWQFHHKLEVEQLSYAGRTARVRNVGFYHGSCFNSLFTLAVLLVAKGL